MAALTDTTGVSSTDICDAIDTPPPYSPVTSLSDSYDYSTDNSETGSIRAPVTFPSFKLNDG